MTDPSPHGTDSGDQQWRTYTPGAQSGDASEGLPPTHSTSPSRASSSGEDTAGFKLYGPPQVSTTTTRIFVPTGGASRARFGCLIWVVGIVVAMVAGVVALVSGLVNTSNTIHNPFTTTPVERPTAHPQTPEGFAEMLERLASGYGGTEVFEAVIYPEYAVLDVPVDATSQRELSLYYNGEFSGDSKSTSSSPRFDLATIRPKVFVRLLDRVKRLVENPTSWYLIVQKPGNGQEHWISAYASNEYSESAYLQANRKGKVLRTYAPETPG